MKPSRRSFLKTCGAATVAALGIGLLPACSTRPTIHDVIRRIIDDMSIEQKVAQLFVVTPEQLAGAQLVREADQAYCDALQALPVCGITCFEENLIDSEQISSLLEASKDAMRDSSNVPMLLCLDEEGGYVQRIGGREGFDSPYVPTMSEVGATNDEAEAQKAAQTIADAFHELGFNTNFAPSCDIAISESSSMYSRSFGSDAELVARMAVAQIRVYEDEGILCCAKHFPGIGDPEEDSHESSIYSNKTIEELEAQLVPFSAAIDAGVPMVMVGHLSLSQITGNNTPASISESVVQGMLRDELGFDGVIVTDSLSMGALRDFCSEEDVAVAAIEAGCDIALMPPNLTAAYNTLLEAIDSERIAEERIDQSLERIISLKLGAFPELFDEAVQEELERCE